jgi:tetratricopeptide (TPR) repeat protein
LNRSIFCAWALLFAVLYTTGQDSVYKDSTDLELVYSIKSEEGNLHLYLESSNHIGIFQSHYNLSKLYAASGQKGKMIISLLEVIRYGNAHRDINDVNKILWAYLEVGKTFNAYGSYEQAANLLNEGILFAKDNEDSIAEVELEYELGLAFYNSNKFLQALSIFNKIYENVHFTETVRKESVMCKITDCFISLDAYEVANRINTIVPTLQHFLVESDDSIAKFCVLNALATVTEEDAYVSIGYHKQAWEVGKNLKSDALSGRIIDSGIRYGLSVQKRNQHKLAVIIFETVLHNFEDDIATLDHVLIYLHLYNSLKLYDNHNAERYYDAYVSNAERIVSRSEDLFVKELELGEATAALYSELYYSKVNHAKQIAESRKIIFIVASISLLSIIASIALYRYKIARKRSSIISNLYRINQIGK